MCGQSVRGGGGGGGMWHEALGIIEYWMPISDYKKPNNNFNDFHEIRDDHCSKKETREMGSIFILSIQAIPSCKNHRYEYH